VASFLVPFVVKFAARTERKHPGSPQGRKDVAMLMERVTELQERMLDGLADSQRRVIDANEKLAERVKGRIPAVPFADRLPKPEDWISVSYGFWGRWLTANRSFAEDLARVWTPEDERQATAAAAPVAPVPVPAAVVAEAAAPARSRARKTATSVRKAAARTPAAPKAAPAKRAPAKRATKAARTRSTDAS
jgi:hypothetical protein